MKLLEDTRREEYEMHMNVCKWLNLYLICTINR
jgi:hypothetical protein